MATLILSVPTVIGYWKMQGVKRFILSVGYKHEMIQEQFGSSYKGIELLYSVETDPLGTGGGLLHAILNLKSDEPFLVLNGDTFFAVNRKDLLEHHLKCGADITLSLVKVSENKRYSGVLLNDDGWIKSMEARTEASATSIVNGGVYLMERKLFSACKKKTSGKYSLEDDLLPEFLDQKKLIAGFPCQRTFIDIGIPKDYNDAAEVLSQHGNIL